MTPEPEAAMDGAALPPLLSIVVVTWNVRPLIERCLSEALASHLPGPVEIIVIDNASRDGTADLVAERFPSVRLIRNSENAGFAGANNQAFPLAHGRYVLLLNPDAFPTGPDTLGRLVRFLEDRPEFAAVGCQLIFPDGRYQVGDAGFRPTLATVAAHALGLTQLFPRLHGCFLVRPPRSDGPDTVVLDVDWICGACMLVRRDVIAAVGGMDSLYFMYGDDIEWGCRMRDHGWRVAYLPGERVIHLQGWTLTGADPARISTRWLDGLAACYAAMNRGRHWWLFKAALAAGFALRAVAYGVLSFLPGRRRLWAKARAMYRYARYASALPMQAAAL